MSETVKHTPADQIIGQIEELFPNWRSYRDLIDCIECTLHDLRQDRGREVIDGCNVSILLEQCERLASPIRANTRSFQYASALDNCVAVIKALRPSDPTKAGG